MGGQTHLISEYFINGAFYLLVKTSSGKHQRMQMLDTAITHAPYVLSVMQAVGAALLRTQSAPCALISQVPGTLGVILLPGYWKK
jgi:hypothetical protein